MLFMMQGVPRGPIYRIITHPLESMGISPPSTIWPGAPKRSISMYGPFIKLFVLGQEPPPPTSEPPGRLPGWLEGLNMSGHVKGLQNQWKCMKMHGNAELKHSTEH